MIAVVDMSKEQDVMIGCKFVNKKELFSET